MPSTDYDVVVIGAGIAGLTASKALVQRGLSVANLEGSLFGGLVTNINELSGDYPGSGADLASNLMLEIADLGCATLSEAVTGIAGDGDTLVVTTNAATHRTRAVVVASGARLRRLGVPGEAEFEYKGVSSCADCDGPMYQGQDVVVVGGGDSALQEAVVLSHYASHVHIVTRDAAPTAAAEWRAALAACSNVTLVPRSEVAAITGGDMVEGVQVRALDSGAVQAIPCTGVFAYIGLAPAADFLPAAITRDAQGAVMTDSTLQTALPGVYAAGAVRAGYQGALRHAVDDGHAAARAVLQRLQS